jgi:hypothetical protein
VTLNVPLPLDGETVAMPLHDPAVPALAVLAENEPLKPASLAVNVCALPAPVARNDRLPGESTIAAGLGAGLAVTTGDGLAVTTGDGLAVTTGDGLAVATGDALGTGDGLADALTTSAVPPEPLHAARTDAAMPKTTATNRRGGTLHRMRWLSFTDDDDTCIIARRSGERDGANPYHRVGAVPRAPKRARA